MKSTVVTCDRCGHIAKHNHVDLVWKPAREQYYGDFLNYMKLVDSGDWIFSQNADLCWKCAKELNLFLKRFMLEKKCP